MYISKCLKFYIQGSYQTGKSGKIWTIKCSGKVREHLFFKMLIIMQFKIVVIFIWMKHYCLYTVKHFLEFSTDMREEHLMYRGWISVSCRGRLIMPCGYHYKSLCPRCDYNAWVLFAQIWWYVWWLGGNTLIMCRIMNKSTQSSHCRITSFQAWWQITIIRCLCRTGVEYLIAQSQRPTFNLFKQHSQINHHHAYCTDQLFGSLILYHSEHAKSNPILSHA